MAAPFSFKPNAMEQKKEYSNGEVTVVWRAHLCQHSGICVKLLPQVYNPMERPWVKPEMASSSELRDQISQCPSGALTYIDIPQ